jgi:hypothetical protein
MITRILKTNLIIIFIAMLGFACFAQKKEIDSVSLSKDYNGPPFKYKCECDFHLFGYKKVSNDNYNIYVCGKGWDPRYPSCGYAWGLFLADIDPKDTTVTEFRVHFLDLEKFEIPADDSDYGQDSLQKYVIAVFKKVIKYNYFMTIFDPFYTGKYKEP